MGVIHLLQLLVIPLGIRIEEIAFTDVNGKGYGGRVTGYGQLRFMHDGREHPYCRKPFRPQLRHVHRYPCPVAQTRYHTSRHTIGRVDHVHQFTNRLLYIMLMTDTIIPHQIAPQVLLPRVRFVRPFIAIRHDDDHRRTFAFRHQPLQRINSMPSLLPRTLIAVNAVNQIQHR